MAAQEVVLLSAMLFQALYETPRGRKCEQIEGRTSNVQHRTLNIDDATLYRFYNRRTAEHSYETTPKWHGFSFDQTGRFSGQRQG
jgi:hypothetical protein